MNTVHTHGSNSKAVSEEPEHDTDKTSDGNQQEDCSNAGMEPPSTSSSSSTASNQSSTNSLLNPNSSMDNLDAPAIALLKQIFPHESTQALRELHHQRLSFATNADRKSTDSSHSVPKSNLGRLVWTTYSKKLSADAHSSPALPSWNPTELPSDFLRLPTSVAVQRTYQDDTTSQLPVTRYEFIADMEQRVWQENLWIQQQQGLASHASTMLVNPDDYFYSAILSRHPEIGLGLKLAEQAHTRRLIVHGFVAHPGNPCLSVDIQPGDNIVGINGSAIPLLLPPHHQHDQSRMAYAVQTIQQSPNPVVLHFTRPSVLGKAHFMSIQRNTSLLDSHDGSPNATSDDAESVHSASTITTSSTTMTPPRHLVTLGSGPTTQPPDQKKGSLLSAFYRKTSNVQGVTRTAKAGGKPSIHPMAKALARRGLIRGRDDEWRITQHLHQFTRRTRQWESTNTLRIHAHNHTLIPQFDPHDLPADLATLMIIDDDNVATESGASRDPTVSETGKSPSTPPLSPYSPLIPLEYRFALYGRDWEEMQEFVDEEGDLPSLNPGRSGILRRARQYPGESSTTSFTNAKLVDPNTRDVVIIPLYNIRKALSTRIVNVFMEGPNDRLAYTIWVYDVETTREWYAPIRYMQDFEELRAACMGLAPPQVGLADWDFPSSRSTRLPLLLGSPIRRNREVERSVEERDTRCRQLEHFLRGLCSLMYTCQPLSPNLAEMAIHVQSFLGVEAGLATATDWETASYHSKYNENVHETPVDRVAPKLEVQQDRVRQALKISIQKYTYRIFLLNVMKAIVSDFVDTTRSRGPRLEDIESLEVRSTLKSRAMSDLDRIQAFLDQMVDLILEGCADEMREISQRKCFSVLHSLIESDDESYWDALAREAVREQVEIEVYVPLRSVVSRLLVNGWRHEDMEVQFKIKELRKRSQSAFRIPSAHISPSHWQSVATILKEGVEMSTLPCSKLRAIVDSAREISKLYSQEHGNRSTLGADDFLPIFIFCVVRADIERPCALGVLLRTLCDKMNRIGEIGYYLACYEAAIAHIQELDLTEGQEDVLSFLSAPLTEVSLDD